jgi:hypothetical protein
VHLAEQEYTWYESAAYSMRDMNRKRIAHYEGGLCAVESGDAQWKATVLQCDEQANKRSPTRLSGLTGEE